MRARSKASWSIDSPRVNIRRRKHWGWGFEDQQPSRRGARGGRGAGGAPRDRCGGGRGAGGAGGARARPAARAAARGAGGDLRERRSRARVARPGQVLLGCRARLSRALRASPGLRRASRARRPRSSGCSSGARTSASPRSPTAGARRSSAASARTSAPPTTAPSRSTCARSIACSRSTRSRARRASRAARPGPGLEAQLAEHGLTLRHFPQSFEFSTLGGWIATRAAGHFATVWTHIEDFVESVRAITPAGRVGVAAAARLGRGREPRPHARRLGGNARGDHRGVGARAAAARAPALGGVRFASFSAGAECVRAISQSGLHPANCRLLDAREARMTMAGRRLPRAARARLRVHRPSGRRRRWRGRWRSAPSTAGRRPRRAAPGGDAVSSWREAFLGAPYLRDVFVAMGVLSETFETAITWERFPAFHERVTAAAEEAVRETAAPPARCSAASPTSTPMGRRPTSRCSRPRAGARRSSSGRRSSARSRTRSSPRAARSPTTTRSGATTGPGMTASARSPSPRRCAARRRRSTRAGIMNPGVLIDPLS